MVSRQGRTPRGLRLDIAKSASGKKKREAPGLHSYVYFYISYEVCTCMSGCTSRVTYAGAPSSAVAQPHPSRTGSRAYRVGAFDHLHRRDRNTPHNHKSTAEHGKTHSCRAYISYIPEIRCCSRRGSPWASARTWSWSQKSTPPM